MIKAPPGPKDFHRINRKRDPERMKASKIRRDEIEQMFADGTLGHEKLDYEPQPNGCWYHKTPSGNVQGNYAMLFVGETSAMAHRCAYALANGKVLGSLFCCHRCDNPPCINPAHLFSGSSLDNVHDAMNKGRMKLKKPMSPKLLEIRRANRLKGNIGILPNADTPRRVIYDTLDPDEYISMMQSTNETFAKGSIAVYPIFQSIDDH